MVWRKWGPSSALCPLLILLSLRSLDADPGPPTKASAPSSKPVASELVRRLGDEQFAERERAAQQLIKMGLAAAPALIQGGKDADREVRYRSIRILALIREQDFQRRLAAFVAQKADDAGPPLPGWDSYRKVVGDSASSRALFVDVQRAEPHLLSVLEQGPKAVSKAIALRSEDLRQTTRVAGRKLPLGSIVALLFLAGDEKVVVSEAVSHQLFSFCYQPSFRTAIQSAGKRELLRTVLGRWIQRGQGWTAYQGMVLSARYDLKEGVAAARRVLDNQAHPAHVRQYAILTVAKLGGTKQAPLLESLLDDQTITIRGNGARRETQIRDVALAALVHLAKLEPKEFGFDRMRPHDEFLIAVESIGFADEASRAKAFKKWRETKKKWD